MQAHTQRDSYEEEREEKKKIDLHAMSKDMSFPFEAVCEAAAAELAGNTLLCTAWPRAVAAAVADGRCKDFWEIEFQNTANSHMSKNKPPHPHTYRLIRFFFPYFMYFLQTYQYS